MAIIQVSSLLRGITRDEALADLVVLAESMGFPGATSWRIGSRSRFWIMSLAEVVSRWASQNALTAAQGFNTEARRNALTKLSASRFDNDRIGAIKTRGTIVLEDTGGVGPVTFVAGKRVFIYDEDQKVTFRNVTGGTLPLNGTVAGGTELELTIEAETGGSAHNVADNSISNMSPVIAGVTVSNPPNPTTWITRSGEDEEQDPPLQRRNRAKWNTIGGNAPRGAYEYWALSSTYTPGDPDGDPVGITRVYVDDQNPGGPNTIYVYIADDDGTVDPLQLQAVQDYIDAHKARTALVTVFQAVPVAITVQGTFRVPAGLGVSRKALIESAIVSYINGLPIGGEDIGDTVGYLVHSELIELAMAVADVRRVSVSNPSADVALTAEKVAVVNSVTFMPTEI